MHQRIMWELVLRSCLRRTRAPEVRPSSDNVNITNNQGEIIDAKLFPEGTCASCQGITLHNIMYTSTYKDLHSNPWDGPIHCPMCRIIFNCISYWSKINGSASLRLRAMALDPRENKLTVRRIYEVEIQQRQEVYPWEWRLRGWTDKFRIYAEPGIHLCICNLLD